MPKPKVKKIYETENYIVKLFDVDETGVKKFRRKKIKTNDNREVILNFGIKNGKTILTSIWYNKDDFTKSEVMKRNDENKTRKKKTNLGRKKIKKRKNAYLLRRKNINYLKRKK